MPIVIFRLYIVKKNPRHVTRRGYFLVLSSDLSPGNILLFKLGYLLEGALELAIETLNGGDVHALGG